jgi:hypothetical protein
MDDLILQCLVEPSLREGGYMGDQGFPPFQVPRVSPSAVMCVYLFCNPPPLFCACNLGTRFSLRGEGCNTLVLNSYNLVLILFVIMS